MRTLIEYPFHYLKACGWPEALFWISLLNCLIFGVSLAVGHALRRAFAHRKLSLEVPAPTASDFWLSSVTVAINSGITMAGWFLWQWGWVNPVHLYNWRILADTLVLLFVMDFLMYLLHCVAHIPLIYKLLHSTHHAHTTTQPLSLFVLNPMEALGFGGLWVALLCLYQASWIAIGTYLTLNLFFGLFGHLGVEPFPKRWVTHPILQWISTSTFHAQHHADERYNRGFYTTVWDRLFGTLSPKYVERFGNGL